MCILTVIYNELKMNQKFEEIENQFQELKRKFKQKKISEREFRYRLKKLRLNSPDGKCWTIGARSGKWYYYDGDRWIEADPPSLQQGKAICIYCGFENDIRSEFCEYCGGRLETTKAKCPKCGFILDSPDQPCPVCEMTSEEEEAEKKVEETDDFIQNSWGEIEDGKDLKEPEKEEEVKEEKRGEPVSSIEDLNQPNYIALFINPSSFFLFFGMLGLILGLVMGAVVGATSLFSEFVSTLPAFFSTLQGKIHGGFLFGVFGGLFGGVILSFFGFLMAVSINVILSIIGGIKLRIDKI